MHSKNGIITEVNDEFVRLTGYSKEEIIGKPIGEISYKLRIAVQINLEIVKEGYSCYIFTQEYEPKEVNIFPKLFHCENEIRYVS
jgi:PAS domain S-box-containing protein